MVLTEKTYIKIVTFDGFITIISNILAVVATVRGSVYIENDARRIYADFVTVHPVYNIAHYFFAFLIPAILSISYVFCGKRNEPEQMKLRLINLPVMYSVISSSGWLFSYFSDLAVILIIKSKFGVSITEPLISNSIFTLLKVILVFAFCYFTLESFNRRIFLPRYFSEGNITDIKGTLRPSISMTFIAFYLTICVFPVTYFLYHLVAVQMKYGISITHQEIIMSVVFLFSFFGLTVQLSDLFTKPLKELIKKSKLIAKGDYRIYDCPIVSNDEFGSLTDSFNKMSKSLQEKDFMRDTFGKVVDPHVRDYLLEKSVNLGGEKRNVTVMFCDIRSFTAMSENMEPEKIVMLLNRYFTALGICITRNGGIINKYIGDAIMAIFGAPVECGQHSVNAIKAALEMRKALVKLNSEFALENLPAIKFGIGIHTGPVLAGNIGAMDRIEYTVIGDTVNTSSRIESLCKCYGKDLLISGSTVSCSKDFGDSLGCTFVAESEIRGREEKVKLYTI